jgi:hypothetical protein
MLLLISAGSCTSPSVVTSQWLIGTMRVVVFLGMVLLITQLILKSVKNDTIWFRGRRFAVMNVVLASELQFLLLLVGHVVSSKQLPCAMLVRQVTPCCYLRACDMHRSVSDCHGRSQRGVHPTHVAGPQTSVVQAAVPPGCHPLCDAEHPGACTWTARPPEQVLRIPQKK